MLLLCTAGLPMLSVSAAINRCLPELLAAGATRRDAVGRPQPLARHEAVKHLFTHFSRLHEQRGGAAASAARAAAAAATARVGSAAEELR
jgi:hypothetical protein